MYLDHFRKVIILSNISMVNLAAQWELIEGDVHTAINSVAASGNWVLGAHVKEFEIELAKFWGLRFAVGCASGLDAIEIGLRSLGLMKGEKVITTSLTAFATTLAIVRAGGVPVYIDVDDSGLLDLSLVNKYLSLNPSVRFMVPVHLFGHSIDLGELQKIKDKYNLLIVEDCAQSIGASSDRRPAGSVGQIAATSFYPTKNLGALGDGGAVLTNEISLMESCRMIRDYGQTEKYHHDLIGMNSRLDEIHAAILSSALLPRLASWNDARASIASRYQSEIHNSLITAVNVPNKSRSSWHLFPIIVSEQRDEFQKYMANSLIGTGIHYPILCNEQGASKFFDYEIAEPGLINAKRISKAVVSIPIHPFMSNKDVNAVIKACNNWRAE